MRATNAIHSAIAAADAICCALLGERSSDGNHGSAIALLAAVDSGLANALSRALSRKNQAAYESRDVSSGDADGCVRQARMLVEAAVARLSSV